MFGRTLTGDCAITALISVVAWSCASSAPVALPHHQAAREAPWRSPESWYVCESDDECDGEVTRPLPLEPERDWPGAIFRLERRPCYGPCPEYRVSLYPDGQIEYEGLDHVGLCGRKIARTSFAERDRLVRAFQAAQYLTTNLIEAPAGGRITDQDTAVTIVEIAGTRRLVWHYGPRLYGLRLTRLEQLMDEVMATKRWTACPRGECRCLPRVEVELNQ